MLCSKIENAHWVEKTTTMRSGIRETATTRNVMLWLFFKMTTMRSGIRETATVRNVVLWLF